MKSIVFLGTLGLVAALTTSSPAGLTAQKASIAGAWTINADASDDLQQVMGPRESGIRRAQTPRGVQRGTRGGGGDGRGGGRQLSDEQRQVGQAMMQQFREGGQRLVIAETDSTVVLIVGGRTQVYYVDERKSEEVVGGIEVENKSKWEKEKFKVETKATGNVKITREFEIDEDTGQLKLRTRLSNSRMEQNFTLERVYDPAG